LTDNQRKQIFNLRALGIGYKTIADKIGLSKDTIKSFCKRNNINGPGEIVKLNFQVMQDKKTACPCCGKNFNIKSVGRPKRFCSEECRRKWWKENPDKRKMRATAIYKLTCNNCNKEFKSYGNKNKKYCSKDCYFNYRFYGEEEVNEYSQNGYS